MDTRFVSTRDPALYDKVRDAFVSRQPKPTYAELSAEFEIPLGTIGSMAADEGWVSLRASALERKAKESDALAVVLEAVKIDRTIVAAIGDVILIATRKISEALDGIPVTHASSTKAEIVNTCTFAIKNLTDAARNVGLTGLSKTLKDAGDLGNGRWNPEMLQQINVTVQNLQAGQAKEATVAPGVPLNVSASEAK